MKRLLLLSAVLVAALGTRGALAQPATYVQGPFGPGGTWNVYEFFTDTATWVDASEFATELDFDGVTGHLVDILSAQENAWVSNVGNGGDWWIGLTDREGAAPPLNQNGADSPQESNGLADRATQGWAWTSGQPFTYQNWNGGEPNDSGGEDAVHLNGSSVWNDHKSGWDIDEPVAPARAGTSTDEFTAQQMFRYVVEYPVQATDPIDGVDAPGLAELCPVLPGVMGVDGQMAVTDFYGGEGGPLGAINGLTGACDVIQGIIDGDLVPDRVAEAQYRISDVTDPYTNVAGGPIIGGLPLPFPSDTVGVDDNDFISIAKGTFSVPEAGTYTLQVRSDDGMGLRVNGTPFTSVAGAGYKDGNGAMVMAQNTGDANTRGIIELAAGDHEFEFMMWERGGGAYWEITKSEGAHPNVAGGDPPPQWRPLVDLDGVAEGILPKNLQGVEGGVGTIGVTDYYHPFQADGVTVEPINTVAEAASLYQLILDGDREVEEIVSGQLSISAARDPDTNGTTTILGAAAPPFPSDVVGTDDNDFISVAKGTIDVPEDGTYTLQVRSDDGFGLRVVGTPFTSVHGGNPGAADYVTFDVDGSMLHNTDTGDSNARGVIELTKGAHQVEMMFFERGGGAFWEITASDGAHPEQATGNWQALGIRSQEISASGPGVAQLVGNATVIQNMESMDGPAGYIDIAIEEIADAPAGSPTRDDVSSILIFDAGTPARPSSYVQGEKFRFPSNEGDDTDFNNFSTGIFGTLLVDDGDATAGETIEVTFGMFTDDHSLFQIIGQDFIDVGGSIDTELLSVEGDQALAFDLPTGNSNSLGLIELVEGVEYDFAGYQHENGGGANYEIWAAPGNQLDIDLADTEAFLAVFYPLSNASPAIFRPGGGFELIEMPVGVLGDYNGNLVLDAADLDLQAVEIAGGQDPAGFDLTGDGLVNEDDRVFWLHDLKGTWVGDADLDGLFDSLDFVAVFVEGLYETGENAGWAQGDWNADLVFDSGDFVAAFVDGGYEAGALPGAVQAVPEPSSLVLALLSLAGLVGLARRRG